MSVWLCRAGRYGEHETKFLEDSKIYFTFEEIAASMQQFGSKSALREYFISVYPSAKSGAIQNWCSQGYAFASRMAPEDWVLLPSKIDPQTIYVGKIIGEYRFDKTAPDVYRHSRSVDWFTKVQRSGFDQEIQSALGGLMTVYKLKQEERIKKSVQILTNSVTPPPEFC